jgi:hypothetical protein
MPLLLLVLFIADLLAFDNPFVAYHLYREWDRYRYTADEYYAQHCLYGAIALLLFILLGRFLIKALLSKHRNGEDEPRRSDTNKRESIKRPDCSIINVEYDGREDGQPFIFVHGLNSNSKNRYYQRKPIEKDYCIILMNLPGTGKSTRPANNDLSLTKLAADLQGVIEHTGSRNPILWGHNKGGMTILTFLA